MKRIKCRYCGKRISFKAAKCPYCGGSRGPVPSLLMALAAILGTALLFGLYHALRYL